jgi:hypothetical protein
MGIAPVADINFFMIPSRIWEIMVGALAAYAVREPGAPLEIARPWRAGLAAAGLGMILFSIFAFDASTPFPGFYALIPTAGTALILLFADGETVVGRILSLPFLVGVGLVSYSAYLWHQPLFAYARLLLGAEPSFSLYAGLIAATFVLAYFSWRWVERPFRSRRRLGRRRIFGLSGAAATLLIAAGAYGALSEGILGRFEDRELAFFTRLENGVSACRSDLDYDFGSEAPCLIGDLTQRPTLVVFGDSHGGPVADGLGPILEAQNRSALVFGQGRCPPSAGTMSLGIPRDNRRCLDYVDDVLAAIEQLDGIETILLAARWERYAYSETFLPLPELASIKAPEAESAFGAGLEMTVGILGREGRRIVILRQVPELPFDGVARMFDRVAGKVDEGRIAFDLPRARYDALASNVAISRLEGRPDVAAFDPYPIFCDAAVGECVAVDNGIPYYRDDNHLWNEGAAMLGSELAKMLEPVPARPRAAPAMTQRAPAAAGDG